MIATQAADVVVRNALDNDSDVGNRYSTQTLRYTRYCWPVTKTATDGSPANILAPIVTWSMNNVGCV